MQFSGHNIPLEPNVCRECGKGTRPGGFSLIELLAVVAVISVITVLLAPAMLKGVPARSGAAQTVIEVIEQARAASLQGLGRTYVVFAQGGASTQDAVMIFRTKDGAVEQLTRWQDLPRGVILHSLPHVPECATSGNLTGTHGAWDAWQKLPIAVRSRSARLSILAFNSSGGLEDAGNGDAMVVLAEGHRENAGSGATLKTPGGGAGIFDVVAVASFSGRPYYFTAKSADLENPGEQL
jgi:prepilin-type N-terminal cleavage/methylation domain-containing protein